MRGAVQASTGEPWLGALVPKRWAKRSVTRHTISGRFMLWPRILRPSYRLPWAYVVRLRAGFDPKQFVSASSEPLAQLCAANCSSCLRPRGAQNSEGGASRACTAYWPQSVEGAGFSRMVKALLMALVQRLSAAARVPWLGSCLPF